MNDPAALLAQRLIRNFEQVEKNHDSRPPLYDSIGARLGTGTAASKLGASIDIVAPGMRSCPYHFHYAQEEMFIVLEGTGTLRVAGEHLPIKSGDIMFIPPGPEYPHQIINSSDAPLKYLSISTREQPELVEYPDSGKFQATALHEGEPVRYVQRPSASLDYWQDEP
ncbi:cupin domain-containing protein [Serratia proteamaculans]|uniref:cupin domain-containing protein n=1 Tax=Serratia proteamaculans TaxID=28151 RepID=UPI0015A47EDE|nr:cupin domain-containing protein [Serratia proteamaculans]NWA71049.1 cupin domain-containing protein [Serratia proteamaculans]